MKRKLISRASKADCLIRASINVQAKSKGKNLDDAERKNLLCQARSLLNEAERHLDAAKIHGDKASTRMAGNQAAKE